MQYYPDMFWDRRNGSCEELIDLKRPFCFLGLEPLIDKYLDV